jgi:hypothetical protein
MISVFGFDSFAPAYSPLRSQRAPFFGLVRASRMPATLRQFWIGIVSREHVQRGVEGGFIQRSHGKKAPLQLGANTSEPLSFGG